MNSSLKINKRYYLPGEEWLYYKLYTGNRMADIVLEEYISQMTEQLIKENLIKKWFFIRYNDPEHHLRIRLKARNFHAISKTMQITQNYFKACMEKKLIYNIAMDTYVRELERYGGKVITQTESLFFHDSLMMIRALHIFKNQELFTLFIIKSINSILESFKFDINDKIKFVDQGLHNFKQEFNANKDAIKQLSRSYREHRAILNQIMGEIPQNQEFYRMEELIQNRSISIKPCIDDIYKHKKEKDHIYTASIVHMSVNRAFRKNQRLHEFICYFFLSKYLNSQKALLCE
ncbi:thiopeptide-type bacteriocin biosynthesis protein [Galbibacter sp. EGI 63066]|uniref:thiopeptide-type bacteriocin biosynthesis protein n=1 Tax=Galbibacter sp. EGI 63066 TaxID=2993559 RepID=UPI0022491FA3|nr:thiopeptide-type bacteriocin biosynthesis protein [Galbibacter sp. EGI 63066]MCX2678899.1 thiopeptide-type bacteriocin biosynthesis protein [Galbibacter sp. EGI 63066]